MRKKRSVFRLPIPYPTMGEDELIEKYVIVLSKYEIEMVVALLQHAKRKASYFKLIDDYTEESIDDERFDLASRVAHTLEGVLLMAKVLDLSALEYLSYLQCLCSPESAVYADDQRYILENQLDEIEGDVPESAFCVAANIPYITFLNLTRDAAILVDQLGDIAMATGAVSAMLTSFLGGVLGPSLILAISGAIVNYGLDILSELAIQALVAAKEEIVCSAYKAMATGEDVPSTVFKVGMEHQLGPVTSMLLSRFYRKQTLRQLLTVDLSRFPQSDFVDCSTCDGQSWCMDKVTDLTYYYRDITPTDIVIRSETIEIIGDGLIIAQVKVTYVDNGQTLEAACSYNGGGQVGLSFTVPSSAVSKRGTFSAIGGGTVRRVCFTS